MILGTVKKIEICRWRLRVVVPPFFLAFPFFAILSNMSVVLSRSSRLAAKGTGAPIPSTAVLKIRGHAMPASACRIQSMDFHMRWREKDYGDAYIEDWCFSVDLKSNLGSMGPRLPTISFWRNFVYFTETRIYFGYYGGHGSHIYKNAVGEAVLRHQIFTHIDDFTLAAPFDEVVARFKAATTKLTTVVRDSTVHSFSLGDVPHGTYIDEIQPPVTTISFV
jgi:hypothetical protein